MNSQDNLVYCGSYNTIQTNGNKKLLKYGAPTYSAKQNELYDRALVGLNAYDEETLYAMNSTKKKRIKKVHTKAQQILNEFKHKRSIAIFRKQIASIIPELKENSLLHKLVLDDKFDPNKINRFSLKDLRIDKETIIKLWISNKVLPANFHSL